MLSAAGGREFVIDIHGSTGLVSFFIDAKFEDQPKRLALEQNKSWRLKARGQFRFCDVLQRL